jgi:hypothetical protein
MDLITNLPLSNKYNSILTIIDQGCSKAAKFIPCTKTIDGQGVAALYITHLMDKVLQHFISSIYCHGLDFLSKSSLIEIQDSQVTSPKQCAK